VTAVIGKLDAAFDVEAVTRQFFTRYREVFEEVESDIRGLKDRDRRRLFTQRLFNRLMFVAFVQRKGWLELSGQTNYLEALWNAYRSTRMNARGRNGSNFYRDRLKPLFFLALNSPGESNREAVKRDPSVFQLVGQVPYLNGGLFEKEADDEDVNIVISDDAIDAILHGLFDRFNFTVTESTPLDVEVAVDPEMLGKVFEELVTGRHETGSYYTPKPIVSFMCQESLKHYLVSAVQGEDRDALGQFIEQHEAKGLRNAEAVLDALKRVKVCDPACGSGAYLLGMLHELLDLRSCLFAARELDAISTYQRKLGIIQNNLYGVDIDPFAVNIARLRLWLSLAVEFEGSVPPPLPNLDFKIEAGDSLTAPDPHAIPDLFRHVLLRRADRLSKLKDLYLRSHGEEKRRLAEAIAGEEEELRTALRDSPAPSGAFDWRVAFAEVFTPRQSHMAISGELNLGDQPVPPYEEGGFDIVLANPPYVRMELIKPLKPLLRKNFPYIHDERTDLYVYFYARSHELLRRSGVGCFISSNKWLRAGYGEKLRQHLLDAQAFHLVVDFGELPVFKASATFPAIFVWQKQRRDNVPTTWAVVKDLQACYDEGVQEYVMQIAETVPASRFGQGKPRLASAAAAERLTRMDASGPRLGEFARGRILWGIKTGFNEAFIIDRSTRDRLVAEDHKSAEVIKKLLVGDDVRRYEIHFRETYLLYMVHRIDTRRYPAIERQLAPFRRRLERRATRQEWYELQQPQAAYAPFFEQTKVIYPDIGKEPRFVMDPNGSYIEATAFAVASDDWFLLGVLNSTPAFEYLKNFAAVLGDVEEGGRIRFKSSYMEPLPIPDAPKTERERVASLAEEAQRLHGVRRKRVERFLRELGLAPADSGSRNRLEQPWTLEPEDFARQVRGGSLRDCVAARDETAALTEQIRGVEREIDRRVAELYGL
jgi:hypothetical protein